MQKPEAVGSGECFYYSAKSPLIVCPFEPVTMEASDTVEVVPPKGRT